jgi:hypothetical protein
MGMPLELQALIQRYCALGRLLPQPIEDADLADDRARAEIEIVLKEMHDVKARIDAFLDAARAKRN